MNLLATTLACATCSVDRGDSINAATSGAIGLMLVILAVVFGVLYKVARYLARCEKAALQAADQG